MSEPPLSVRELVRVQAETLRDMLCGKFLIQVRNSWRSRYIGSRR